MEPIPLGQLMQELLEHLEAPAQTHHEAAADAGAFVLPEGEL
jgi:hypothetical protein